ncbi:hypothetical protein [Actinokineospora terrae]|uniref:Uncharacterized protein n=1 Tax=Actinokineospora terrae TaxID=155974 RepID=A0A1H9L2S1_9PSEU|nr:hypothetical protein [Actinokineospora terrae]SER05455.1 hypothetical protein SAMN04487818_101419 [Actinokineospora terrae]
MRMWWVVVLALVAGCQSAPAERVGLGEPPRRVGLGEVSKVSDLVFAEDDELVAGWYSYFQEWHLAARVRVGSVDRFRKDNGLAEPAPVQGAFRNPASDADPGWEPEPATGVTPADTDVRRSVRFVRDGSGAEVVYLVVEAA